MALVTGEMLFSLIDEILTTIKEIRHLSGSKYDEYLYYKSLNWRRAIIYDYLANKNATTLFYNEELQNILKEWKEIEDSLLNGKNDDELRDKIAIISDKTFEYFTNFTNSILDEANTNPASSRWANNDTDQEEINDLKRQLAEAKVQLQNNNKDKDAINKDRAALSEEKENLTKTIEALKKDIEERKKALKQKEDNKEKELEERITGSFKIVNEKLSILKNEEDRMKTEYVAYNFILCALSVLVIVWLIILVISITGKDSIKCWYTEIAPWYAPTPFVAAFFWVLIVFKNKANRYLLRIREELFKINYCEGLLLSISKLSKSTEEGAARVSDVLDTMVKSYINQIETSFLFESKKTERDTPVDASDITKAAEVITDFADKIKDIAKSK